MEALAQFYLDFPYYFLLLARMLGLFASAPFFGGRSIPALVKIGLSFFLSFLLFPVLPVPSGNGQLLPWLLMLITETMVGIAIGFVSNLTFYAIQVAGQFIDMQLGIGFANVVDPQSGIQVPIMGNFKQALAMLIFLAINGHHWLLEAVFYSYEVLPLGKIQMQGELPEVFATLFLHFFIIALQISIPAVGAVFITDIILGIVSRTIPQMNVFVVGMPLKIFVGLFVVMLAIPLYIFFLQGIFEQMLKEIFNILSVLS